MRTSQLLTVIGCLLATIFAVASTEPWRPQGRFGKRQGPTPLSEFGISRLQDIPVEMFFSKNELKDSSIKPKLCSVSGIQGYPVCESATPLSTRNAADLENYFDL